MTSDDTPLEIVEKLIHRLFTIGPAQVEEKPKGRSQETAGPSPLPSPLGRGRKEGQGSSALKTFSKSIAHKEDAFPKRCDRGDKIHVAPDGS